MKTLIVGMGSSLQSMDGYFRRNKGTNLKIYPFHEIIPRQEECRNGFILIFQNLLS